MIIKSLIRKDKQSYAQLIEYISREAKVGKKEPLFFSHNIMGVDPEEISTEMRNNYEYRQRINENENSLLHYVLSFHKEDTPVLSRDVLTDIVYEFIDEFSPNGMAYGAMHSDKDHLHCHVVFTANELESNDLIYKKRYLNKEQKKRPINERGYKERTFEESKNNVRTFARDRAKQYAKQKRLDSKYREHGLYHSFDERFTGRDRNGKVKSKDALDNRVRKNGRGTRQQKKRKGRSLQILSSQAMDAFKSAKSFDAFIRNMQGKGYTLYRTPRGTVNGIVYEGKKYRFSTTLLPLEYRADFNSMRRQHQLINERHQTKQSRNYSRKRNNERGR